MQILYLHSQTPKMFTAHGNILLVPINPISTNSRCKIRLLRRHVEIVSPKSEIAFLSQEQRECQRSILTTVNTRHFVPLAGEFVVILARQRAIEEGRQAPFLITWCGSFFFFFFLYFIRSGTFFLAASRKLPKTGQEIEIGQFPTCFWVTTRSGFAHALLVQFPVTPVLHESSGIPDQSLRLLILQRSHLHNLICASLIAYFPLQPLAHMPRRAKARWKPVLRR